MCYGSGYSTQNDDIRSDNNVFLLWHNIWERRQLFVVDWNFNGLICCTSPPSKQSTIIHSFGGSLLRKCNKWWNGIAIANTHFLRHNQIKYFLLSKSKSISIILSIWLLIISIYVNYGAVYCMLWLGKKKNFKLTMKYRACGFIQ